MKLVEILAKKLNVWPTGAAIAVQDGDARKTVKFGSKHANPSIALMGLEDVWQARDWGYTHQSDFDHSVLASDWKTAIVTEKQWRAELDRQKGGEWKRHRGMKRPVDADVFVEVKLRCGDIQQSAAANFIWPYGYCDSAANIMQYRIISQPQAEEVAPMSNPVKSFDPCVADHADHGPCHVQFIEAKTDQIDGPIKWRDEIVELEAHAEDIQREIVSLFAKLNTEGFQLIRQYPSVSDDVPAVDMSDWRNWKAGDIVESREKEEDIHIGEHYVLTEDVDPEDGEVYFNDSNGDDRHRDANKYRFIRRP